MILIIVMYIDAFLTFDYSSYIHIYNSTPPVGDTLDCVTGIYEAATRVDLL